MTSHFDEQGILYISDARGGRIPYQYKDPKNPGSWIEPYNYQDIKNPLFRWWKQWFAS